LKNKLDYETAGYWDGNIGKQSWANINTISNALEARNYLFSYDPIKRLKTSSFVGIGSENYSLSSLN
jgi:hypothetical protein